MTRVIGPPLLINATEVVLLLAVLDCLLCALFLAFLTPSGGRVVLERPADRSGEGGGSGGVSKHEPSLSRPAHRPCLVTTKKKNIQKVSALVLAVIGAAASACTV